MDLSRPKAHCECILAQHWLAKRKLTNQAYPLVGVSSHACHACHWFLEEVLEHLRKQAPGSLPGLLSDALRRMIPGTTDAFRPCMVPEQSPTEVEEAVAYWCLDELKRKLSDPTVKTLLQEQLRAARERDTVSDSYHQ